MQMNAREAMHLCELRSSPQGHPSYRRVAQEMHRLIAEQAGHRAIAAAMRYVDHGTYDLERLDAERAAEARVSQRCCRVERHVEYFVDSLTCTRRASWLVNSVACTA